MLSYILYKNIEEWFKRNIEINDFLRCIADPDNPSTDIKLRYNTDDPFYSHFADNDLSRNEHQNYLYPYIGISFGDYIEPREYDCNTTIPISFLLVTKPCSLGSCSFEDGNCSIAVPDPRYWMSSVSSLISRQFYYPKILDVTTNPTEPELWGTIIYTDLFSELRCSQVEMYDCDTDVTSLQTWNKNVWAKLRGDPIFSSLRNRPDGLYEMNVTINLQVFGWGTECVCTCGACESCVCNDLIDLPV